MVLVLGPIHVSTISFEANQLVANNVSEVSNSEVGGHHTLRVSTSKGGYPSK